MKQLIDAKKVELFETIPIPRAVAKLAVPTVLSSLVMVIYNLADTYFVGLINSPVQTAAVTYAAPVLLSFNALSNLFGTGCSSLMSRALGRHDYDTVGRTSTFGFFCALFCALLLALFTSVFQPELLRLLGVGAEAKEATCRYLFWTVTCGALPAILTMVLSYMIRSEGAALHASIGTMCGCFLNIILDPIFILPQCFDMGAAGAGCATFISNCVSCSYFIFYIVLKRKSSLICLNPKNFAFRKAIIFGAFAVGIPAAIQNLLNVTGMTVLNNFTAEFGSPAVAAMGITHKVNMIPMFFAMGLGQGIMPLVGYNYASGNSERMKSSIMFSMKIIVSFLTAVSILYYIFAGNVIGLFMDDSTVVAYGTRLLRGFCLGMPFLAVDFLAVGIFQAVGMGRESLIFAVMRKIVLEIPAIIILNKIWPLYGMSYSQLCAEAVLAVAAVCVLARLFKRVGKNKPTGQA